MNLRWLLSGTVRQADAMVKHVRKILNHQRDILAPKAVGEVEKALGEVEQAMRSKAAHEGLIGQMEGLETVAGKWLKPYPNAAWRENVEVLLVALAVALGIRTFFLQPFKIPTGSMQPSLFGVTSENLMNDPDVKIPTGLERIKQWFQGVSYIHVVAKADGELRPTEPETMIDNTRQYQVVAPPLRFLIFNLKQTIYLGGVAHTIWFPPDYGGQVLEQRAGLYAGQAFHKGEDVVKLKVSAGDHLFVDRLTYNFVPPSRGQIVVFETKGIPEERRENRPYWSIPPDQFYIKRLVGLGGERIQIGDDRHLVINGKRLDASTPHFENVYGFDPKSPPRESLFSGHVNALTSGQPIPLFKDGSSVFDITPGNVMVMGDNTMNSLDSRFWGEFPETFIIGRAFSVYWPITDRFGWSCSIH